MSSDTIILGKMKSDLKALKYVDEGKVFPLQKTKNYIRWCVEGTTGVWTVRYDVSKETYSCNCKNIRLTPCSHIKAVEIFNVKEI